MKRESLKSLYTEEYDYLEFIKRSVSINQVGLYGLDEGRTKRHLRLLRKYGYAVDKDKALYKKSKVLMDNLDVMIDMQLEEKVTGEECFRLAQWLESEEFRRYMEGKSEGIHFKGYFYT